MDDVGGNLDRAMAKMQERLIMAIDAVETEMVNFVKARGPWTDRTSYLRNSIGKVAPEMIDGTVRGFVTAGAFYAPFVEFTPGRWVLSGAVDEFGPRVPEMIAGYMQ